MTRDEQAASRDLFEPSVVDTPEPVRTERLDEPRGQRHAEPREERQRVERQRDTRPAEPNEAFAPPPKPVIAPVAVAAFHAVSQHDDVADEAPKPVRRRRNPGDPGGAQEAPLQLVETQAAAIVAPAEDDLPHRTKPRRRRGGDAPSEPLKLVETQPGAEQRADNQP